MLLHHQRHSNSLNDKKHDSEPVVYQSKNTTKVMQQQDQEKEVSNRWKLQKSWQNLTT